MELSTETGPQRLASNGFPVQLTRDSDGFPCCAPAAELPAVPHWEHASSLEIPAMRSEADRVCCWRIPEVAPALMDFWSSA
jgi:hypothetical protein